MADLIAGRMHPLGLNNASSETRRPTSATPSSSSQSASVSSSSHPHLRPNADSRDDGANARVLIAQSELQRRKDGFVSTAIVASSAPTRRPNVNTSARILHQAHTEIARTSRGDPRRRPFPPSRIPSRSMHADREELIETLSGQSVEELRSLKPNDQRWEIIEGRMGVQSDKRRLEAVEESSESEISIRSKYV